MTRKALVPVLHRDRRSRALRSHIRPAGSIWGLKLQSNRRHCNLGTSHPSARAQSHLVSSSLLRFVDGASDKFGDLGTDRISDLLVSVYPSGNPMTCSAVSGTGYRWPSTRLHQSCQLFRSGFLTPRLGEVRPPLNAVAFGVGHNPNSVAKLSGTSVGSRYAVPLSIIPERGQVSENGSESPSKQSCDVFHNDESGSNFANKAGELAPQSAS